MSVASFDKISSGDGAGWAAPGYTYLFELDRAGWAWEWLRRNPDFASLELANEARASAGTAFVIQPGVTPERSLLRWGLHYG